MMKTTADTQTANELISDLLEALGFESVEEIDDGAVIQIENGGFMDLYVEKQVSGTVTLSHYIERNLDRIPDPSVTFKEVEGRYVPTQLRQKTALGRIRDEHDPDGLDGVQDFINMFTRNLRQQGFVEAAADTDPTNEA